MSLASGGRLGPYEIVGLLGAGGMGEVYRARDSKLQREVAIKVLPEAFALDVDRLARFQREAQVLASLNHPNIATIHSFEEVDGVRALVMELVDGPTLADRIAQGPIPLGESLHIARQIVDGLDAAHERGIIHRDLKPANIKLRPDGTVKVLDFGLAKAMEPPPASVAAVTLSPTITTPAMTGVGAILGTAAYMSPEQAKGRVADKRSDVWAFGCVLYEMLSGRRPFEGEDVSDTFAFILTKDPEWAALPPATSVPIRRLLRRCLEKHQRRRLADIADARLDLEEATSTSAVDGLTFAGIEPMRGGMALRRAVAWMIVAAASAAAVTFVVLWAVSPVAPPLATHRLVVELGADVSLLAEPGGAIALSNDDDVLAFVAQATPTAPSQLYVRRLENLQAQALAGTEGAFAPFFSPDGEEIAFFAAGKLKKVAVSGGAVGTLSDVMSARGGSWAEDDTITFTPDIAPGLSLLRVSAAGGQPAPLGMLLDGEVTQRWPQSLLGRDAVLYTSHNDTRNFDAANLVVRSQRSMETKIVLRGGYSGRYVSSGHLVYIREGTLLAAPFDIERLETTGPSVPAVEGVAAIPRAGGAHFSISDGGTLVYVPGQSASGQPISWMDRAAKMSILAQPAEAWANPQFSPDGRSLALQIGSDRPDVWVYDLARETFSRLTLHPAVDLKPVWTPDSQRITFSSQRAGTLSSNLYWQRTDSTEAQRLTTSPNNQTPGSWHPTSRWLAFSEDVMGRTDLMILPLEGDAAQLRLGTPTPFSRTSFNEIEPMFSPDGRWLAYASDESGHFEVYVRPFPSAAGKETISTGGGSFPTWSRTRPELFYRSDDGRLMVSSYAVERETFRAQKPRPVADTLIISSQGASARSRPRHYDLHPDGNRFAIASVLDEGSTKRHQVVVVVNFFEHLRLIAPVK